MAKLIGYGGVGDASGANFLLDIGSKKIMVDCGLMQGTKESEELNKLPFAYDPSTIDILFITHAHADHIGRVPKLVKEGFKGEIYSTKATRDIAELMLADMVKIGERAALTGAIPLYNHADVDTTFRLWKTLEYHTVHDLGDFKVELRDPGHILGAAMCKFTFPSGKSIVFTGDIGNSPSPILRSTEVIESADYILMESVYGDRRHEPREARDAKFRQVVEETIAKRGTLLIPAFSLERTQVILYELNNLFENKLVPQVPVFLDSPLAIRVTEIYERVSQYFNESAQAEARHDDIFKFPKLRETAQVRDSREIVNVPGPKIIIAGSGMSTAGRIVAHEEIYLPDPSSTLLLVGYQAPGTPGRLLESGAKKIVIDDHTVEVRAKVEKIEGFSGHADTDQLVEFVSKIKGLDRAFVAMGELKSSIFLAQRLRDELEIDAIVPEKGKAYEIDLT